MLPAQVGPEHFPPLQRVGIEMLACCEPAGLGSSFEGERGFQPRYGQGGGFESGYGREGGYGQEPGYGREGGYGRESGSDRGTGGFDDRA